MAEEARIGRRRRQLARIMQRRIHVDTMENAMRALLISHLRPRPPAVRPGVAGGVAARAKASTVDCVDVSQGARCDGRAIVAADLIAFHLPMHTATRLAAPLIERVRAAESAARASARTACTRRSTPTWLRELGVDDVLGGEFEEDLARDCARRDARDAEHAETAAAERSARERRPALPSSTSSCPIARAAAARALRDAADAGRQPAGRRLHRGEPRLPAPLPPLSGRAGLRRAVPRRAARRRAGRRRARRSRRARSTSRSAIPISSTARRTRCASSSALARGASRRDLRRDDQDRAPAAASRPAAAAARHRLPVRHERRRVARRSTCCALEKGHTRADFVEPSACAARPALTLVPTFVAFHPG